VNDDKRDQECDESEEGCCCGADHEAPGANGEAPGSEDDAPVTMKEALKKPFVEMADTFKAFAKAPKVVWGLNISYALEGLVYFGILTVLTKYLAENVSLGDLHAGWVVAAFTGGITITQLLFGTLADRWGVRRALLLAMAMMVLGRVLLAGAESFLGGTGMGSALFLGVVGAMLMVALAYGMYQPAAYSAMKRFTTEKTAAMGFAMLYAGMNLGGFFSGVISPPIRKASEGTFGDNGISGVFIVYAILTAIAWGVLAITMSKKAIAEAAKSCGNKSEDDEAKDRRAGPKLTFKEKLVGHPFADLRFVFFICVLIPVQTLFAHQWLTMPLYINRAYVDWVADNFEFFSNLNPILIFVLAPTVAALTAKANVYKMMIWGTLVMALPTFLLCFGEFPILLFAYILIMSIGEAMWQPRFLQHVAEIAPPGKTGAYMGIAQLPWFLTKVITGLYSGWFLANFVPEEPPQNTQLMWALYGAIAMISPIALYLARGWFQRGKGATGKSSNATA